MARAAFADDDEETGRPFGNYDEQQDLDDQDEDDDIEDIDDDDEEFDCHRTRDGGCELAGTEECEFECPYRDDADLDEDDFDEETQDFYDSQW